MAILYTFGPSHFCEKARWAVDICGVPYREVRCFPGPHMLTARRIAPGGSLPILESLDRIIQGSCPIMDWLEATYRPPWRYQTPAAEREQIEGLAKRANEGLGPAIRRLVYAEILPTDPDSIAQQMLKGVSWGHGSIGKLMWPVIQKAMMNQLQATSRDVPEARERFEQELDDLDTLLQDGRRFLVGDHLTRADITAASLISPIARPPEHPVYSEAEPWPAFQQVIAPYQDRPGVRWAQEIYRDFRQKSGDASARTAHA
ncbi:MAG: glutathione S-transferase [Pseudomonadota bacterium]